MCTDSSADECDEKLQRTLNKAKDNALTTQVCTVARASKFKARAKTPNLNYFGLTMAHGDKCHTQKYAGFLPAARAF